jgi:hypothetical protein
MRPADEAVFTVGMSSLGVIHVFLEALEPNIIDEVSYLI